MSSRTDPIGKQYLSMRMALDDRVVDQPGIECVVLVEFHSQSKLRGVVLRISTQGWRMSVRIR